jgi:CheY-like chemotaxis protein
VLEHAGYAVERAPDGWEALERLSDRPFDVVLCRLEQDGLSGEALLARIRAVPHLKTLPIVIVSDRPETEVQKFFNEVAPPVELAALPLRRRPLLDAINRALQ